MRQVHLICTHTQECQQVELSPMVVLIVRECSVLFLLSKLLNLFSWDQLMWNAKNNTAQIDTRPTPTTTSFFFTYFRGWNVHHSTLLSIWWATNILLIRNTIQREIPGWIMAAMSNLLPQNLLRSKRVK